MSASNTAIARPTPPAAVRSPYPTVRERHEAEVEVVGGGCVRLLCEERLTPEAADRAEHEREEHADEHVDADGAEHGVDVDHAPADDRAGDRVRRDRDQHQAQDVGVAVRVAAAVDECEGPGEHADHDDDERDPDQALARLGCRERGEQGHALEGHGHERHPGAGEADRHEHEGRPAGARARARSATPADPASMPGAPATRAVMVTAARRRIVGWGGLLVVRHGRQSAACRARRARSTRRGESVRRAW